MTARRRKGEILTAYQVKRYEETVRNAMRNAGDKVMGTLVKEKEALARDAYNANWWGVCQNPYTMLTVLSRYYRKYNRTPEVWLFRKLRLWLAALHYEAYEHDKNLPDWKAKFLERLLQDADILERMAEGEEAPAYSTYKFLERTSDPFHVGDPDAHRAALTYAKGSSQDRPCQLTYLRCVFENPFHTLDFTGQDRAALDHQTVQSMAASIYQERTWKDTPILADALEDAGMTNQIILTHLRNYGSHARGCWVVDRILGRG